MLIIDPGCQDHFAHVMQYAAKRNLLTGKYGLLDQLHYLGHYAEQRAKQEQWEIRTTLYWDFAPQSFRFNVEIQKNEPEAKWQQFLNGGLIYSGPDQPLDGSFPALTVSLADPHEGWSTHT